MYWSAGLQRWITVGDDGESTLLLLFASMIVSGACVYYHLFFAILRIFCGFLFVFLRIGLDPSIHDGDD